MGTLTNSKDPDEMTHNAFHQGLHCLLIQNRYSENFFLIITCDHSIYTMDHPDLHVTVSNFMENSIGLKRVK